MFCVILRLAVLIQYRSVTDTHTDTTTAYTASRGKNCILEHITDKNFPVTCPPSETTSPLLAPKLQVLEPPLPPPQRSLARLRRVQVGTAVARDRDLPPHDEFSYFLDRRYDTFGLFELDKSSGVIRTREVLDRERQSMYNVVVIARSNNRPSLVSTAHVQIEVRRTRL